MSSIFYLNKKVGFPFILFLFIFVFIFVFIFIFIFVFIYFCFYFYFYFYFCFYLFLFLFCFYFVFILSVFYEIRRYQYIQPTGQDLSPSNHTIVIYHNIANQNNNWHIQPLRISNIVVLKLIGN